MGYIHGQELPQRNKYHCKTRHHLPGRRNPEFFMSATVKHTLVFWCRKFQYFNLERKLCVIENFWNLIWIQRPKIHQKQTFFLMGQNPRWPLLLSINFVCRTLIFVRGNKYYNYMYFQINAICRLKCMLLILGQVSTNNISHPQGYLRIVEAMELACIYDVLEDGYNK